MKLYLSVNITFNGIIILFLFQFLKNCILDTFIVNNNSFFELSMTDNLKKKKFKDRKIWRKWLEENHLSEKGIWLIYYKKHTGKKTVIYNEAVEEALCFGWIDTTVRRIDEEQYCQKFTPRNDKSVWSDLNKERVNKLIKNKSMTKYGLKKVQIAKKNGMWDKEYLVNKNNPMPKEFKTELGKNKEALKNFNNLAPSHKKHFINWIVDAKKEETKIRRSKKAASMLENNQKLGM